jgi:hypothetical protein
VLSFSLLDNSAVVASSAFVIYVIFPLDVTKLVGQRKRNILQKENEKSKK